MKILVIEPGKHPYEKDIEHILENLQSIVGGHIEAVYPFEDEVALVCHEEALFDPAQQWNRIINGSAERGDNLPGTSPAAANTAACEGQHR